VEYNTGVLFFTQSARRVFEEWTRLTPELGSTVIFTQDGQLQRQTHNDQCAFAAAVDRTGFCPFVLPMNWNFRPQWQLSFFGPINVWHDYADVPPFFYELPRYYAQKDAVIQFHSAHTGIRALKPA
jgi:hypothetical protein